MKTEQLDFDLNEDLPSREFQEENLCICWVTKSDGRAWADWWAELPQYKRNGYLSDYRTERDRADLMHIPMRSCDYVHAMQENSYQEEKELAERWAVEIKQAAIERRSVPFQEGPNMSGLDRLKFQIRLRWAFELAGVVIIDAAPANDSSKANRRAAA